MIGIWRGLLPTQPPPVPETVRLIHFDDRGKSVVRVLAPTLQTVYLERRAQLDAQRRAQRWAEGTETVVPLTLVASFNLRAVEG